MYSGNSLLVFGPSRKTRQVSLNLMRAHAQCYRTLKGKKNGPRSMIGLVKNINIFDPYRAWNPLHRFQAKLLDGMFNRCWIRGLKTGRFKPPSGIRSVAIDGLKEAAISLESIITPISLLPPSCQQRSRLTHLFVHGRNAPISDIQCTLRD